MTKNITINLKKNKIHDVKNNKRVNKRLYQKYGGLSTQNRKLSRIERFMRYRNLLKETEYLEFCKEEQKYSRSACIRFIARKENLISKKNKSYLKIVE